jgi:hypothetical protein
MKRLVGVALAAAAGGLLWAGLGSAAPVGTAVAKYHPFRAGATEVIKLKFEGGRRACVIAMGDHDPIVPVTIEVYDADGKRVTSDNPATTIAPPAVGADLAAALWYPPRDAEYTIKVTNHGSVENKIWIAIR